MKIAIVSSSQRKKSQSLKVAKLAQKKIESLSCSSELIDLIDLPIDLDISEAWTEGTESNKNATELQKVLNGADAAVFVTPEWNGMASAQLKNAIHHVGTTLAHKPVMLISVSAGAGGSNPIIDLKAFSAKNSHAIYVPEHLIVREVNDVLNGDTPQENSSSDKYLHQRLEYSLEMLKHYAEALNGFRKVAPVDFEGYGNGM